MKQTISQRSPHWISLLIGAIGGGVLVMIATRAIPTMLANFLSGMMGKMMSKMEASGFNPHEMCQKMMASFTEAPKE